MTLPQWKEFEILVAKIQKELAVDSIVTHNDKILGKKSKQLRQIDVSIRSKIGQFDVLIIIDCKDYAEPVDIKAIEEFMGLVDDAGAQQAAIVAAKGFTEAAKTRATEAGLGVYTVVDTDPHKWQVQLCLPVLCDFRSASYSLKLQFSYPKPFRCPDPNKWVLFDANRNELGIATKLFAAEWNAGKLPIEEGEYKDLDFLGQPILMDYRCDGELLPIRITAKLRVKKSLYFGKLSIEQISGFKDEKNGAIISKEFTTGEMDIETVKKEWHQINSEDELTVKPIIVFTALLSSKI